MTSEADTTPHIFVPLDLTDLSPTVIEHACHIAGLAGADLHFYHWVKDADDSAAATEKINDLIQAAEETHLQGLSYVTAVREGDYMKEITEKAKELKPLLVIVGTHGLQGMEFFTGTHAIRIVADLEAPVMVVQGRGVGPEGYKHITVPMELEAESKQKLPVVNKMAQLFGSTVHLFTPSSKDEFYRNGLRRNLEYAKEYLEGRGVNVTTDVAEKPQRQLDHAVEDQVEKYHTDLIIITNWHQSKVIDLFGSEDTQEIMMNEMMIPVILVNPKEVGTFDLFGWG
jgi:nucleotide-binding universal stress UspA family protein